MMPLYKGDRSRLLWITSAVFSFVAVIWQGTCLRSIWDVEKEKGRGMTSPSCTTHREKSILSRFNRGWVPVFKRPSSNPAARNDCDNFVEGFSPTLPAGRLSSPICIRPFKKVPVVMTMESHWNSSPLAVRIPLTSFCSGRSFSSRRNKNTFFCLFRSRLGHQNPGTSPEYDNGNGDSCGNLYF